ncbi:MAG: GNAT family N-acetyltransferase [Alphaproteobacteria bacterium]
MLHQAKPALTSAPVIREMQQDDVDAVSSMAARIWRSHYVPDIVSAEQIEYMLPKVASREVFAAQVADTNRKLWIISLGDVPAGYAAVIDKGSTVWFLDKLYIDSNLQRTGLGFALLDHILNTIKPEQLVLRVNRKNIKAINFYFKHGFVIDSLDVLDLGDGFVMDDFIMKRVL